MIGTKEMKQEQLSKRQEELHTEIGELAKKSDQVSDRLIDALNDAKGGIHRWMLAPGVMVSVESNVPLSPHHWDCLIRYAELTKEFVRGAENECTSLTEALAITEEQGK